MLFIRALKSRHNKWFHLHVTNHEREAQVFLNWWSKRSRVRNWVSWAIILSETLHSLTGVEEHKTKSWFYKSWTRETKHTPSMFYDFHVRLLLNTGDCTWSFGTTPSARKEYRAWLTMVAFQMLNGQICIIPLDVIKDKKNFGYTLPHSILRSVRAGTMFIHQWYPSYLGKGRAQKHLEN